MRGVLLILSLVVVSEALAQPTITNAEYFIGTDPGEGLATTISVPVPAAAVNLAWTIPTASLAPNLYYVMLRVQTDTGLWSQLSSHYLIIAPGNHSPFLVTQFEWAVDDGAFVAVDIADDVEIDVNQLIATAALAPGILHKVKVRVSDNTGRTGQPHIGYLAVSPANQIPRLITQFEWAIDGGVPTVVGIEELSPANLVQVFTTSDLAPGTLHAIDFRVTDDLGRVSEFTNALLPILPTDHFAQGITTYEYWVDSEAPISVDPADAPFINISELIATDDIPIGLHYMHVRASDNAGRTGKEHRVAFIVMSPYQNSVPRSIIAAEVFAGNDPGIGNGVDIPLPLDGAWSDSEESVLHVFTGFEVGYYRIGFRTQDDFGRWSQAVYDSLLVGPLLTIFASGNDAILSWQFPDNIDQYYVYRSANTAGPFALIDSTSLRTYTDPAIFSGQDKGFYYVTFRDDSISLQQPGGAPVQR